MKDIAMFAAGDAKGELQHISREAREAWVDLAGVLARLQTHDVHRALDNAKRIQRRAARAVRYLKESLARERGESSRKV